MRAFRPFFLALLFYAAIVAVCWAGWAWVVSPEGIYARIALGLGGFGLIGLGARCLNKCDVWPAAMRCGMWTSGLGALAYLAWLRPSAIVHITWVASAAAGVALLWAGFLSVPRLEGWRQWIRRLTVYCVLLQAPWPVTPLLAQQVDKLQVKGLDGLGVMIVSFTFWYVPLWAFAIVGTVGVFILSITRREVSDNRPYRGGGVLSTRDSLPVTEPGEAQGGPGSVAPVPGEDESGR